MNLHLNWYSERVIDIKLWYIIPAILVFGFLIFIHELGHFLCARFFGVGIKEFSIGMGPRIGGWVSKKSNIKYSLRLLPFGGYVSMLGEDEDSDDSSAFCNKTVWKRMLIVLAGPIMNLFIGFMAMLIMVTSSGELYSAEIDYPEKQGYVSVSQQYGLCDGDYIIKIGNVKVHTRQEVAYEIMRQGIQPVDVTVKRGGERILIEGVIFPCAESEGIIFGAVDFYAGIDNFTVGNVLKHTFFRSVSTVKMVVDSFVDLIRGRYGMEALTGPVGMTQTIGESVSDGLQSFLYIFVVITINLGVLNLFPIPALDGGRFLFLFIEAIIGHPLNPKFEGYVQMIGLFLMLGLVIMITFKDIIGLF